MKWAKYDSAVFAVFILTMIIAFGAVGCIIDYAMTKDTIKRQNRIIDKLTVVEVEPEIVYVKEVDLSGYVTYGQLEACYDSLLRRAACLEIDLSGFVTHEQLELILRGNVVCGRR